MTPAEHYSEAERRLDDAAKAWRGDTLHEPSDDAARYYAQLAQVHATLAVFPRENRDVHR